MPGKRSVLHKTEGREPHRPDQDQSQKAIKNWLKSNVRVGTIVAIKRTQNESLHYRRGIVLSVRPKNFNVGIQQQDGTFSESGITFDYAGRHWREPSGGVQIVIPTEAVLAACDGYDPVGQNP
jgi:hypothetical protein